MSQTESDRVERVALAIYDAANLPWSEVRIDKAACIAVARVALKEARDEIALMRGAKTEAEAE